MRILQLIVLAGASVLPLKVYASETAPGQSGSMLTRPMPRDTVDNEAHHPPPADESEHSQGSKPDTTSTTTTTTTTSTTTTTTTATATPSQTTASAASSRPGDAEKPGHTATPISCLKDANAAREQAGFPIFASPKTEEQKLPLEVTTPSAGVGGSAKGAEGLNASGSSKKKTSVEEFCKAIRKKTKKEFSLEDQPKGIYMYASQKTEHGDCAAAVQYWKGGVQNFPALPPVYSDQDKHYTNNQIISFVGLYNPKQNPTLDCAFITCQPQTASANNIQQQSRPHAQKGASDNMQQPIYSILCFSTPQALNNNEDPFTQEEWNQITGVGDSSTQPTVLVAVTLAVAALGLSAF